ncbi:hypothetical protein [uncultured Dokdonia sp.]|uniref:hypothetical protein n=1 Tax=uncultured Dokdonia sp. TaxID=575653 RepID=UPI00262F3D03|nr:hypothetical protein [uncultured Dokdonia sp.]
MRKNKYIKLLEYLGIPNRWSRLNASYALESKIVSFEKIKNYYSTNVNGGIPDAIILEIAEIIANYQYDSYRNLWKEYPKSRKRYSIFDTKDLKNPFVYWKIMDYLKVAYTESYQEYACVILGVNKEILQKQEVYKGWYDIK